MATKKKGAGAAATAAAKKRLAKLDAEALEIKRNKLRAQASMGSRVQRREASTALSKMPKPKKAY